MTPREVIQGDLDKFLEGVTELVASGEEQDQEVARQLLLKASVSVLLLQTLYGAVTPTDAEWLRSVYGQIGDVSG